jgi:hypothetical protein
MNRALLMLLCKGLKVTELRVPQLASCIVALLQRLVKLLH